MTLTPKQFRGLAWGLSGVVAILAVSSWGQGVRWQFSHLSTYRIFPLFGLLAFSLVLSMYVISFLGRHIAADNAWLGSYYKALSVLVLAAILAHPGLLWWQLWRDGFGLPPESYLYHYVAPGLVWVAVLGTISWSVFLLYELRFKYRGRSWWKYIEYAGDGAMVAIFYHALRLGTNLQHGWFKAVWYLYGVILLVVLFDIYSRKLKKKVD